MLKRMKISKDYDEKYTDGGFIDFPFQTNKINRVTEFNPNIFLVHTENGKIWTIYMRRGKLKLSKKVSQ